MVRRGSGGGLQSSSVRTTPVHRHPPNDSGRLGNTLFGVRYLSDDWLAAADRAVRRAGEPAPSSIVIDQWVDGAGGFRVVIGPEASVAALRADTNDDVAAATFRQTLETARAIATGATDAHQAFLLGRIEFSGDLDRVIAARDALAWLEATLAPVMEETTWD